MIVELLVGTGLVLAGAAAARVILRRRQPVAAEEDEADDGDASDDDPPANDAPKRKRKRRKPARVGPRGLRVGDVLLYADTELWLAGRIDFDEEGFALRLFPSPGSTRAEWVAQLDEEATDLAMLSPTDDVPGGQVPEALPIAGRRLTLERRGHANVRASGEHLPRTNARGVYTILTDAGGRTLVVVDFEKAPRIALIGDRVAMHMIDLLPGGDLDDEA